MCEYQPLQNIFSHPYILIVQVEVFVFFSNIILLGHNKQTKSIILLTCMKFVHMLVEEK